MLQFSFIYWWSLHCSPLGCLSLFLWIKLQIWTQPQLFVYLIDLFYLLVSAFFICVDISYLEIIALVKKKCKETLFVWVVVLKKKNQLLSLDLPYGWEQEIDEEGQIIYVEWVWYSKMLYSTSKPVRLLLPVNIFALSFLATSTSGARILTQGRPLQSKMLS